MVSDGSVEPGALHCTREVINTTFSDSHNTSVRSMRMLVMEMRHTSIRLDAVSWTHHGS